MEVDLDDGGSTPEDVMDLDTVVVRKEPWSCYSFLIHRSISFSCALSVQPTSWGHFLDRLTAAVSYRL